jgi:glucoamylase
MFAKTCQNSGGDFDRGAFLINGTPRNWTDQSDGPALQTLAILQLYAQLDAPTQATATALQAAGDQMLQAVVFHSDNLELSEQFDATTGYEKSVSNLSWSYASFLSAIRARNAI